MVWDRSRQPFGAPHVLTADAGTDNLLRFPSQREAALTGLHYNYHRDYGPMLGRYLQPDPIGLAGGDGNLYAYVAGDPVNLTDPDGMQVFDPKTGAELFPDWVTKQRVPYCPTGDCAAFSPDTNTKEVTQCMEKCAYTSFLWPKLATGVPISGVLAACCSLYCGDNTASSNRY